MALPLPLLRSLQDSPAKEAWKAIFGHAWEVCSQPLTKENAAAEVTKRDREIGDLDLFLASAGWDLWFAYEACVEHAADAVAKWWAENEAGPTGRAVLILDGLSLREVPWLLQGAAERGYKLHSMCVAGAELPADTTRFANAMGFPQRSALENNGASSGHRLPKARTEALDHPWADCASFVGAEPNWALWHHWPDNRAHALAEAGQGLTNLVAEVVKELTSDDFWTLVKKLTTGRRLLITSDHGYCASGLFSDVIEEQSKHLKELLKSGRCAASASDGGPWVPPVSITLTTKHGTYAYAVGRRKWKSPGGYPTLTHGGLSVLEVAVPMLELSRME